MKLLTLTSDMGLKDHYVAAVKASVLRRDSMVQIVDISHSIEPFNTVNAAFVLSSCISEFPDGTVHIIAVDSEPIVNFGSDNGSFPCILEYRNQYIISNDNGFFGAFLGEESPEKLWRIDDILSNPKFFKFPSKNMLVPAAIDILNNKPLDVFCTPQENYKKAFRTIPSIENNLILGSINHIDVYGNAITNIDKVLFERIGQNHPYIVYFRMKQYYLDEISNSYNEVPPGERVGLFNENGFLEIAINRGANAGSGGAEKLFGLKIGSQVRIEFMPPGSKETLQELF